MKLVWSPRTLERASEIAQYIAEDNLEAAKLWLIEIYGVVGRLEEGARLCLRGRRRTNWVARI
jgi:plasmid stabilization system protein ParE